MGTYGAGTYGGGTYGDLTGGSAVLEPPDIPASTAERQAFSVDAAATGAAFDLAPGQFRYAALLMGADTDYPLRSTEGLRGLDVRSADQPAPRGHGALPGKHFRAARAPVLEFVVRGRGKGDDERRADLRAKMATLRAAFAALEDTPAPLHWHDHGVGERLIHVRPITFPDVETLEARGLWEYPRVALTAADPRIYGVVEHNVRVPLYDPAGGGIDGPVDGPIDAPPGGTLEAVAVNGGDDVAYPLVRFYGPQSGAASRVALENRTTGDLVELVTEVLPGQQLIFDGHAYATGAGRQVIGIDGATRYAAWQAPYEPLALAPGANVLRFTATATGPGVGCTVVWRDTYLS